MLLLTFSIFIILLLILYFTYNEFTNADESFSSCWCDIEAPQTTPMINPFVYPYAGATCYNDAYIGENSVLPISQPNEPDHVALTN